MRKLAFTTHDGGTGARGMRAAGTRFAVRDAAPNTCPIPVSPHLLDLANRSKAKLAPKPEAPPSAPRGIIGKLRHVLDEKIHLHDLRMRTLSVRPRGWKDFPPAGATTMLQAVRITASRFLNEHPLADLTIVSVIHLSALMVWNGIGLFARGAADRAMAPAPAPHAPAVAAPSFLPLLVIPEPAAVAQTKPTRGYFGIAWHPEFRGSIAGFAAVAALLVLPLGVYGSFGGLKDSKNQAIADTMEAVRLLKAAGDAAKIRDFAAAGIAFGSAKDNFDEAKRELGALATMLNAAPTILPGTSASVAGPLLAAGRAIADGGERLSMGLAALDASSDPASKIEAVSMNLRDALPQLEKANRELNRVSLDAVPAEYRSDVADAKAELPKILAAIRKADAVAGVMGGLMGRGATKRYLVVFQNNAELRPTGGFMGSFALIDVRDGKVKNMEIPGGGTYDLKGQLAAKLRSPQPLHLINPRWQFQDANWFPDFPSSAKQIDWFYGKAGGPTTDGVIAVTATFMEKLLAITGPIEMPEYDKVINAQNFFYETQRAVEVEYDKDENRPKQFIADLAPKVIEKVLASDRDALVALAGTLDGSLARKEIQLWMKDADLQSSLSSLGWTGEMKSNDSDYLFLVHTNIAGQKTDLVMKDEVTHAAKVLADGTAIVTLTISRTHGGQKGAMFSGVRNVDYLRVYVPAGSALVEARGFEAPDPKLFKLANPEDGEDPYVAAQERAAKIDRSSGTRISEEGGKTVFGNWIQTDPGETTVATLVYQLPAGAVKVTAAPEDGLASLYGRVTGGNRDRIEYSLLVQQQAGANPARFTSSVDLPRGYYPAWQQPARTEDERGRWSMTTELDRDAFFGTVAESQ